MSAVELACDEFVELVTDYLEGALPSWERERFDAHLGACGGCASYLEQIRTTMALTARVPIDGLPEQTKAELLAAFRGWRNAGGAGA